MRNLLQWENFLQPYFQRHLRLIGEIPLSRRDVEDMADSIRAMIQESGNMTQATERLVRNYPHVFLSFLTGFAAHNSERDFWGQVAQHLKTTPVLHAHGWHTHYVNLVKERKLRYFSSDETSRQFVTTIRYHGGIPAYSLPDFFTSILLPSIQRPTFAELSSDKTLGLILKDIYNVDAPVINFLSKSGELGVIFFQACREMARHYLKEKELPALESADLPTYVIESFADYMEKSQEPGLYLRKPALFFDPYDEPHLHLRLPEEQIPLRFVEDQILWEITWTGQQSPISHKPAIHMQRGEVVLRESYLPLDVSSTSIRISLIRNGASRLEPIHRWNLPCLPPVERPVLAFRQSGQNARYIWQRVSNSIALPATTLLLIVPTDVSISADGEAHCLEHSNPYLGGRWSGWKAETWNLQNASILRLLREHNEICPSIPIEIAEQDAQLGGSVSPYSDDPDGIPLYAGHTPKLKIPIRPSDSFSEELSRWKIELRSWDDTLPVLNLETDLSAYSEQIQQTEDNFAELDLGVPLEGDWFGTFRLCIQSPFDMETEFFFRVSKPFYVVGLPKFVFPSANGAEPLEFSLRLPESVTCESQPGADDITVESGAIATKVTIQPESARADLFLVKQTEQNEIAKFPIYVPVSRFRWAFQHGKTEDEIQWTTIAAQMSIDEILQSLRELSVSLHIHMRGLQSIVDRSNLLLIDPDRPDEIIQEEKLRINPISSDWLRVSLSPFLTTLSRYEQTSQLELHFQYRAYREEESVRLPLALFTRSLDIQNIGLQSIGDLTWLLQWDEPRPLRDRRVLIGSDWRPWQDPFEFQIPDRARGKFVIKDIGLLPLRYRIHFYTAPTYAPSKTEIPSSDFVEIAFVAPEVRLAELAEQKPHNPTHEFLTNFEQACILAELGEPINTPVNICIDKIKNGQITNLIYLMKFHDWLSQQPNQQSNANATRIWMYKPEIVRHAVIDFRRETPERRAYCSYATTNKNLHTDSILLFIRNEDDPIVLNYCLKELIRRHKEVNGLSMMKIVELFMEMIEEDRLLSRDAADLLVMEFQAAIQSLALMPETSIRENLLERLTSMSNPESKNQ